MTRLYTHTTDDGDTTELHRVDGEYCLSWRANEFERERELWIPVAAFQRLVGAMVRNGAVRVEGREVVG